MTMPWKIPYCGSSLRKTPAASLALGALIWLWTLGQDALARACTGQPWTRLAVILGAVTLGAVTIFTAWASWLLRTGETTRPSPGGRSTLSF